MDDASRHAAEFLRAIGRSRLRLAELALRLESRPEVVRALYDLAPVEGRECLRLDGYVDAELRSGDAVAWLLDGTWTGEQWTIEHCILRNHGAGQNVLTEHPVARASTLDDFIVAIGAAIDALVESVEDVELQMLTPAERSA